VDNNSSEGFGFIIGILIVAGLVIFGLASCASKIHQESRKMYLTAGGGVADFTYDKHRRTHSGWRGSAKTVPAVTHAPASNASEDNRCTDNPYAQSAANTFGVPVALIECIHYAESRCRSNEGIRGKYSAWSAVVKLAKPDKQRHALRDIADDLGVPYTSLRSNTSGAMGPFQMIPTTWVANRIDADHDGDMSPYSLADATYGAANMLARVKAKKGSWREAIRRYNAKPAYVNRIASCAGL